MKQGGWWIAFLLLPSILTGMAHGQNSRATFACDAAGPFFLGDFERSPSVSSPDGLKRLELNKSFEMIVYSHDKPISKLPEMNISASIEVSWAPDSAALFVMYSDGGSIGAYHVRVFRISDKGATEVPAAELAYRDFKKSHFCPSRGENNVFGLRWIDASAKLFLVLEVYPTGDCEQAGEFLGYLVRTTDGHVLKRYNGAETKWAERFCAEPPKSNR